MATLRYQLDGQEHWVNLKDVTTIGRADINDVCIPLISLSRQHAIINRFGNGFTIADLGSSNGIEINGEEVKNYILADGMKFLLGDIEFTFYLDQVGPARSMTTSVMPPPNASVTTMQPVASPASTTATVPAASTRQVVSPVSAPAATPVIAPIPADQELAIAQLAQAREAILGQLGQVIIGQRAVLNEVLVTLFSQGHALIIGVPGLAKTLIVRTLGAALALETKRIQFTPDLMPSDITGTDILEEDPVSRKRVFRFNKGPIFTNMLLADEINRTPPKTQAALLEAMQERRVTAAGTTFNLPAPFLVLATQNPIEQEGTYPLPEAQLDRFMFAINIGYPSLEEEQQILVETTRDTEADIRPVLSGESILHYQRLVRQVPVSEHVALYAANLARATRPNTPGAPEFINRWVRWGAGPRAGQYLLLAAKAHTLLSGRFSVSCADVREYALPVLRHRIFCNFAAASEGVSTDDIVRRVLEAVPEPQY